VAKQQPIVISSQPIVILGGFLITQEAYQPMRQRLAELSGQALERVELVPVGRLEWLLTVFPWAWARILDRVAAAVERQASGSPTGGVTLVGHSSGGIMARLFLDDRPFEGRRWNGRARVNTLVMLGSPHTALKATPLRQKVARELPGCVFAPAVRYVSVAGAVDLDPARGEASDTARRMAPTAYRNSTGDANDQGDGLVPVRSALLEGSEEVVLEGVAHGGAFGPIWYGSPEVVTRWWAAVSAPM
jgi:pimeloyl-ACP methyl ester carboxylesterase